MFAMKKFINIITMAIALVAILQVTGSCSKVLSKDIAINNVKLQFDIEGTKPKAGETEDVLYEGDLDINITAELEKQGLSAKNLKSLNLKNGRLELVSPAGFDMNVFKGMKLYFGDNDNKVIVAKANEVKNNVAYFTINASGLKKFLNNDKIHITITGPRPIDNVRVTLITDYVVNIGLL